MKSNLMRKRALNDVSDETIQQGIQEANAIVNELALDDPRVDAIAEIEARLRNGSDNALEDIQQLAQFRRAIRGQRPPTGTSSEWESIEGDAGASDYQDMAKKNEASGSDNFFMNNEHPESVERQASEEKEAGTQGEAGFVTDRDQSGKPKAPYQVEVPRLAAVDKEAVAPPGWEGTVKEMKKHPEIDNPWALAWSMKDKGYHHHAALTLLREKGASGLMKAAGLTTKKKADTADNAASEKDGQGAILPKTDADIKDTQGEMPAQKKDVTASKTAAPAVVPAPAADVNIFNSWTSDCLAAAIKAVTSTAEYAADKAAQTGVGMMNDALKNRPAMPENAAAPVTASKKEAGAGSGGFTAQNPETGVIVEGGKAQGPGDKAIPSSHEKQELQGLDASGKITRPETKLPETFKRKGSKFEGDEGVRRLMGSLKLAEAE